MYSQFNRKLLFSIFNIAARTYSSRIIIISPRSVFRKNVVSSVNSALNITTAKMSSGDTKKSITFEEVKTLKNNQTVLLVDVREPNELAETGVIPGSINIPFRTPGSGQKNDGKRRTISFDEVKTLKNNTTVLLIDVRQPSELAATGKIPGSVNIPLGGVETTLKDLPPEEFLQKFHREKPKLDTPLVFSCRSGRRSEAAQDIALKLGFKDVRNFVGGWLEWEEKIKKL